jgi:hypothetical protein
VKTNANSTATALEATDNPSGGAKRYSEESNMFRRLTTHFFIIASRLFITCGLILAVAPKAEAQEAGDTFEAQSATARLTSSISAGRRTVAAFPWSSASSI